MVSFRSPYDVGPSELFDLDMQDFDPIIVNKWH